MALSYGFYNSLIGTADRKYDAVQLSSMFDGLIWDGIFSGIGTCFTPTCTGTNLIVTVGPGKAWFNHTWTLLDTPLPLTFDVADALLYRMDTIYLEVDTNAAVRANSIKIAKGPTYSNPSTPSYATLVYDGAKFQYPLAFVQRRPASATILYADLNYNVGHSDAPLVTGIVQQMTTDAITANWNSQFNTWFTAIKALLAGDPLTTLSAAVLALQNLTAPWGALITGFTTNVNNLLTRMTNVENRFNVNKVTANVSGITGSDVTLVTAPVVIGNGVKRFKISATFRQIVSNSGDVYILNIRYNGTVIKDLVVFCNTSTAGDGGTVVATNIPTAGNATYSFTIYRFSGAGTGMVQATTTSPIEIFVEQVSGT